MLEIIRVEWLYRQRQLWQQSHRKIRRDISKHMFPTSDMARMHEGDRVQVVMDGLSQNVYGTISGSVSRIDSKCHYTGRAGWSDKAGHLK